MYTVTDNRREDFIIIDTSIMQRVVKSAFSALPRLLLDLSQYAQSSHVVLISVRTLI